MVGRWTVDTWTTDTPIQFYFVEHIKRLIGKGENELMQKPLLKRVGGARHWRPGKEGDQSKFQTRFKSFIFFSKGDSSD